MSKQPLGTTELSLEDAIREANALRDTVAAGVAAGMNSGMLERVVARLEHLAQLYPNNPAIADAIKKVAEVAQVAQGQQAAAVADRAKTADAKLHSIDATKEPLAASLDRLGLWTEEEKKILNGIAPEKPYMLRVQDEQGNFVEEEVKGQKIRDAMALLKACDNQDKLDERARREFYKAACGNENGPQTEEERKIFNQNIQNSKDILDAYNTRSKDIKNDKSLQNIDSQSQAIFKAIDNITRLDYQKSSLSPTMRAAATPIIQEATKKLDADIIGLFNNFVSDVPTQQESKNISENKNVSEQKNDTLSNSPKGYLAVDVPKDFADQFIPMQIGSGSNIAPKSPRGV